MLERGARAFAKISAALRAWPKHPIDTRYGIETSGKAPRLTLRYGDRMVERSSVGYAGSQPSIIRAAIEAIPDIGRSAFIDLGCGKGRALAVATEFPFQVIHGIELSPGLSAQARRNMAKISAAHPERTRAQIICGDATTPVLPDAETIVLYLYNPFGGDLIARLLEHLTEAMARRPELTVFLVYYNPTQVELIDGCSAFSRYYAAQHDFAEDERGSSPFGNNDDSLTIWQSLSGVPLPPKPGADRVVRITIPDLAAEVIHDAEPA